MPRSEDKQYLFDWPQDTEPSPDDEETVSFDLSPEDERPLCAAQAELAEFPTDPELLLKAAAAALLEEQPELSLRYLHRFSKRYAAIETEDHLLRAVALAQQGRWTQAAQVVKQHGKSGLLHSFWYLPCDPSLITWFRTWLITIDKEQQRRGQVFSPRKSGPRLRKEQRSAKQPVPSAITQTEQPTGKDAPHFLPAFEFSVPVSISFPEALEGLTIENGHGDLADFKLRSEFTHLSLLQVFDELLCLPHLHDVDPYSYQIEAARKVLKQFRGRVLLADEVGLGKTVEAGMVLKEYLLRGMSERVLILTPASLVKQWQEEMAVKFGINCATSYDSLLRRDAESFWAQPRVIASIATARRAEHLVRLAAQPYDLIIVDEAHHLKNRATANWKLVNALQKRFLLLLSATPVQNNLVEIYNLLTLLKPGIFKTEREFRANYMSSENPRSPANSERLRDLMRDVMIRNTRSLVDVRLPPRHASTIVLDPSEQEAACYQELSRLAQAAHRSGPTQRRLALRHLLAAAGSTPATAAESIGRFVANNEVTTDWLDLMKSYELLDAGSKQKALCQLLRRNPEEKKIVFVHHRATVSALQHLLQEEGMDFVIFEGAMSGSEKDRAIALFREEVRLLLCTESGGEGRNLQFCNTIINFDLPWNPMAIEQRIGRIHRIGQTRDVFIFNLVVRHTLEEHILKILDEKINMFELVVGEVGAILGELDEDADFAEMVFAAWMETTESKRQAVFNNLGERLAAAKSRYDSVKSLDAELFGDEFAAS